MDSILSVRLEEADSDNVDRLYDYFVELKKAKVMKKAFPGWDEMTFNDFQAAMINDYSIGLLVYASGAFFCDDEDHLVGHMLLENFSGKCAICHFATLPIIWGITPIVGKLAMEQLANMTTDEGYILNYVVGVTPSLNRLALRLIRSLGFKRLAIIPDGGEYINELCDGILTILDLTKFRNYDKEK